MLWGIIVRQAFAISLILSIAVSAVPRTSTAFENQWHLGVGAGLANYDRGSVAPSLGLHGAYGMSDSFDARLELLGSLHGTDPIAAGLVGITYKLDVIQLIPWGGLAAGAYYLGDRWSGEGRNRFEPGGAVLLGLDYAWSRKWGLSLAFGLHMMPFAEDRTPVALRYTTSMLRIEHRWGW